MVQDLFLSPLYIFPPIGFFQLLSQKSSVEIDAHEHYQKRSHRNRYDILSANGKQTLTIPLVKGKNQQQSIKDVQISYDDNWINNHLNAIKSAYGKAPYFEYYFPIIEDLLCRKYSHLYDLNIAALNLIILKLKIKAEVYESKVFITSKSAYNYHPKPYNQVFEYKFGFVGDLSIIDLLMNVGPESILFL